MPAPRGWIAGPYVWLYNGLSLGITQDGFNLNYSMFGDKITGDNLGDATQDYVYRGIDCYMDGQLNEWDVARVGAVGDGGKTNVLNYGTFWPWADFGVSGQIGRLASVYSAPLVGTPAPGTTADSALIKNISMTYAVLPPGFNMAMMFAARLRSTPIRFQSLPTPTQLNYGNVYWVVMT